MKYLVALASSLALLTALGCKEESVDIISESGNLAGGEWLYVDTYNNLADYGCYVCPNFKPEEVIYRLTFDDSKNSISGRVRNLIITANYQTTLARESTQEVQLGTFKITDFKVLNKPWENEADGIFQDNLQKASSYRLAQSTENKIYDELQLGSGNDKTMYFVRKR